ncbi:MAG: hypothetical protein J2P32_17115 [Actinobacteria bacterium]|nr:hypothetical protein [Actinomycetota bacterium]
MDCAVPGLGGGTAATDADPDPEDPDPEDDWAGRFATLGEPTSRMERDAASVSIICWRCCSRTAIARPFVSAVAAIAAPGL